MIIAKYKSKADMGKAIKVLDRMQEADARSSDRAWQFKSKSTSKDGKKAKFIFKGEFKGQGGELIISPEPDKITINVKTDNSIEIITSRALYYIAVYLRDVVSSIEWVLED